MDELELKDASGEEPVAQDEKGPLLNFVERGLILIALLSGGIAFLIRRRAG